MSIPKSTITEEGSRFRATFGKVSKLFIDEESAKQWLLFQEGEYIIKRPLPGNDSLSLEVVDSGLWDDLF